MTRFTIEKTIIILLSLCILLLTIHVVQGETSVIEIPLRVDNQLTKRVPIPEGFFVIGYSPRGELFAIPEEEFVQYELLAAELEIDFREAGFMPPGTALGNYATATIDVVHSDELAFWIDDRSAFITWSDNEEVLEAPEDTVNGTEIVWMDNPGLPHAPSLTIEEE